MLKVFLRSLGALPLPVLHALGIVLGLLFYVIPNRRRRTARINLGLCFPKLSARQRQWLLLRNQIEFGKTATEVAALWTCGRRRMRRLVRRVSGEPELKRALAENKGVLVASPHLGAWEMIGLYCSNKHPMSALYSPLANAHWNRRIRNARERFGARLVPANGGGLRILYKALDAGQLIAILPDQIPRTSGSGVFAPFFGIATNTMTLLSRLAAKTGAPVVFAYAERLSFGRGYHLHFLRAPADVNNDNIETSATAVNAMMEKCIRVVPTQYQWIYKRFRGRRAGEKKIY